MHHKFTPADKACLHCGAIYTPINQFLQENKKYCCRQCADEARKGTNPRYAPGGPGSGKRKEHQVIAETILGRKLEPDECVHHKDENKLNNDPANLQIMTNADHARLHNYLRWPPISPFECKQCGRICYPRHGRPETKFCGHACYDRYRAANKKH